MARRPVTAPRRAAHRVLIRLDQTTSRYDDVVRADAGLGELEGRDAALAWELVAGTTRWRRSLDAVLSSFAVHPLDRTPAAARAALRVGAYQLLFLDRIPAHAAIDESVSLARPAGRRTAGFVNAVLRRVATEGAGRLAELGAGDSAHALGIRLSYPDWLVERWIDEWGRARAEAMLAAGDRPPERSVRVNRLKASVDEARRRLEAGGVDASPPTGTERWRWTPDALIVSGGRLEASAAFREGLVTAQSRASQLVGIVASSGRPDAGHVVDVCAAPGLKTAHLAALRPAARIMAVEVDPGRAAEMRRVLRRLGVAGITVIEQDATTLGRDHDRCYDLALLDAPCSGLGTVAGRPDLRWRRRPGDAVRLAARQTALFERAASLLAPGGVLVYAVCTLERAETVDIVVPGATATGLVHDDLGAGFPGLADPRLPTAVLTMPDRDRTSGFFIARLRRER